MRLWAAVLLELLTGCRTMIVIGLTGGIGTGKSAVSCILSSLGASVIDADTVGHEVYRKGTDGFLAVLERFGSDIVGPDGEIDRESLGSLVFRDPESLASLNSLVHPRIRAEVGRKLRRLSDSGVAIVVLEAAVLMEAGWVDMVDEVWVVDAPKEVVVRRLMPRFGGDIGAIDGRMQAQMGRDERLALADEVIVNDGSVNRLRERVEQLYLRLTEGP